MYLSGMGVLSLSEESHRIKHRIEAKCSSPSSLVAIEVGVITDRP